MSYVMSFLSGKGGVTKTTWARATGVKFTQDEWVVGGLDIDTAQTSFMEWQQRRLESGHKPLFHIEAGTPLDLVRMKAEERFHLIIVDGAAYGSVDSVQVAKESDLIVVPCRFSKDDMNSAVKTMHSLVAKGVPPERFCVVFSGVPEQRTAANYAAAHAYMSKTPYFIASGYVEQMNSITDAQNEGLAMNEVRFRTVREKIDLVMNSIVDRLDHLTSN
ncbi:hypothetical protein EVG80_15285 [Salmonella enterica subsp. enterica serovar Mississippi]|nr:hypothetical protein [Salmonella enterica subsp. enterica serovar Mississippi]